MNIIFLILIITLVIVLILCLYKRSFVITNINKKYGLVWEKNLLGSFKKFVNVSNADKFTIKLVDEKISRNYQGPGIFKGAIYEMKRGPLTLAAEFYETGEWKAGWINNISGNRVFLQDINGKYALRTEKNFLAVISGGVYQNIETPFIYPITETLNDAQNEISWKLVHK